MRRRSDSGVHGALLACVLLLLPGCSEKKSGSASSGGAEKAGVGGFGKELATGVSTDLRASPDGSQLAYLLNAEKPRLQGIAPQVVLGELHVVPSAGGGSRKLANSVTNTPGGFLFSTDSRWIVFLAGYITANHEGQLHAVDLIDPESKPLPLGMAVTYMQISPDSKSIAFVDGGVLKVGPLGKGPFVEVAAEVATAHFAPDNSFLLFKRRLAGASALHWVPVGKWSEAKKLGDQVGDYGVSPDSQHVAFTQRSEVVRGTYDLLLAHVPAFKAEKLVVGTGNFAFSADSKWLARTEGQKPEVNGDLYVGPASGGPGRKLGEKVNEFSFAPDSSAIAYLELYDVPQRSNSGIMGVTQLPDGKPRRLGTRVPNYTWGQDGRYLAFLSRFIKPIYSVDLMLYPVGAEEAFKVREGVFGYGFGGGNAYLALRTSCVREGRACDLHLLDLSKPKEPSKKVLEGVYSFKSPEKGARLLVTYARMDSILYDVAVFNPASGERRTLEQHIQLPAQFIAPDGSKVAYVVGDRARAGVYVASEVP